MGKLYDQMMEERQRQQGAGSAPERGRLFEQAVSDREQPERPSAGVEAVTRSLGVPEEAKKAGFLEKTGDFFRSAALAPTKAAVGALKVGQNLAKEKATELGLTVPKKGANWFTDVFVHGGDLGMDLLKKEQETSKAAEVGAVAGDIALSATALGKSGAGMKPLAKAGERALESGVMTSAQEGEAGKAAAFSAVTAGALSLAGDATEAFLKRVPNTAWDKILRRTPTEKIKKPNLGNDIAEEGVVGASLESLGNKAKVNIERLGDSVSGMLDGKGGAVDMEEVAKGLDLLKRNYSLVPGEESAINMIDDIQKQVAGAGKLDPQTANVIKQKIYKVIEDSYGRGMMDVPAKTAAQKEIAKGIKKEIEKAIPEVKSLNQRQGVYLALRDAVREASAKTQGQGILGMKLGLYDLGVGGAALGASGGNPLAAAAAVVGKQFLESPAFLSSFAKAAHWFNELPPSAKMAAWSWLNGLTSETGKSLQ